MYGEGDTTSEPYGLAYQPFRLTKKETPAPGYALLADLQTTLHANGPVTGTASADNSWAEGGQHTASQSYQYHNSQPGDYDQQVTYANNGQVGHYHQPASQKNMRELDNLLDDLDRSRHSAHSNASYGSVGGGGAGGRTSTADRPSVDALLNELSTAVNKDSQKNNAAASSATEELDVLMASLSTFNKGGAGESESKTGDATYAKPNKVQRANSTKDQLDSMLGNLQADMNKQGISATTKGCCTACDKPIVGQVVTALGRTWHPEHFVCAHCRHELGTQNFLNATVSRTVSQTTITSSLRDALTATDPSSINASLHWTRRGIRIISFARNAVASLARTDFKKRTGNPTAKRITWPCLLSSAKAVLWPLLRATFQL